MPRIEATVSCNGSGEVDVNMLQRALAEVVRSITGQSCQVIVNTNSTSGISERVRAYQVKRDGFRGGIEVRP